MTEHTPGPWVPSELPDLPWEPGSTWLNPDGWVSICTLDEDGPADVVAYCHPINAPIIAAAPDLLLACEALVHVASHADDCARRGHDGAECTCVVAQAHEAIAKAKGE